MKLYVVYGLNEYPFAIACSTDKKKAEQYLRDYIKNARYSTRPWIEELTTDKDNIIEF